MAAENMAQPTQTCCGNQGVVQSGGRVLRQTIGISAILMLEFVPPLSRPILHSVAQRATTHRDEKPDSAALDQIADHLWGLFQS
jgi:hypothetical protein